MAGQHPAEPTVQALDYKWLVCAWRSRWAFTSLDPAAHCANHAEHIQVCLTSAARLAGLAESVHHPLIQLLIVLTMLSTFRCVCLQLLAWQRVFLTPGCTCSPHSALPGVHLALGPADP